MKNKEPQNCWEFNKCPESTKNNCPAHKSSMGRECWLIASRYFGPGCSKSKIKGFSYCLNDCEWFKRLNPDLDQIDKPPDKGSIPQGILRKM